MVNIAIDGPSGAGKSTIAKKIAAILGYIYIDTGAMYRAVALDCIRRKIDISSDEDSVVNILSSIDINIEHQEGEQHIFLNGEDVSDYIRTPEVSMGASAVGTIKAVREKMTELQINLAKKSNCVMDGRDIGTAVLPDADVKIYLTADVEERAKRRFSELREKNVDTSYEEVLTDMKNRDLNDSTRQFSPLKKADDAHLIDTTFLSLEEAIECVKKYIKEKIK